MSISNLTDSLVYTYINFIIVKSELVPLRCGSYPRIRKTDTCATGAVGIVHEKGNEP
jgi:hypothetical protein